MLLRLVDKFVFGIALLLSLQVPQLADHYHQFLFGQYEATRRQVDGYAETANQHGFDSIDLMIDRHLNNNEPSVRTDALQKLVTLESFHDLREGVIIFERGNLVQKSIYMFNPDRHHRLRQTLENFKIGIPLTLEGIGFGFVLALLLNFILIQPLAYLFQRLFKQSRKQVNAK